MVMFFDVEVKQHKCVTEEVSSKKTRHGIKHGES